MRKIRKMQSGFSFPSLSSEFITGASYIKQTPYINSQLQQYITKTGNFTPIKNPSSTNNTGNLAVANGINAISSQLTQRASDKIFGDSELGRGLGTLFSSGVNSAANTMGNNILKGAALSEGVMQNAGASLAGAGAGLAANYAGQGITKLMGDSRLGRAVGAGFATTAGTIGGNAASKALGVAAGSINPYALAGQAIGSALGAATGPSKEYGGRYGKITQGMDMAYDALSVGANFIPGIGQGISAAMVLNKGLSNIFGSTDGMTKTDAILGSAFMPAPVKWLNMAGAHKTGTFNNQSWQNQEKASSFMQDAFGNLQDKFDKAREEAGKTYGTFSRGAYNRARNNLNFANKAWGQVMAMADQNELQNIRSQYMSSINNQRYAQDIQGGWSPLVRGKQGMKILNNATNHNIGMRLLSAAALIDSKQMILSAQNGTKIKKKGIKR